MIHGVPESQALALSVGQGVRDRSGAKATSEATQVQEKKVPLQSVSQSEDRSDASDTKGLAEKVEQIQQSINQIAPQVQFSVEEDLNRVVVKVVERDSGELIRQFPPEEVLNVQRFFDEQSGVLLEEEA